MREHTRRNGLKSKTNII